MCPSSFFRIETFKKFAGAFLVPALVPEKYMLCSKYVMDKKLHWVNTIRALQGVI